MARRGLLQPLLSWMLLLLEALLLLLVTGPAVSTCSPLEAVAQTAFGPLAGTTVSAGGLEDNVDAFLGAKTVSRWAGTLCHRHPAALH